MKKLPTFWLRCGLAIIGLMLLVQTARAGGAAVPFRQTWKVSWATMTDSVKFDKFLGRGEPAADAGCDIKDCVACRVRNVTTPTELAFKDCPLHVADASHQCADYGSWWQRPIEASPVNGKPATAEFGCAFTQCLHCRAKSLQHASATGQVCSHHGGSAVHYCHGVVVQNTTYHDLNPSFDFPIVEELQIRSLTTPIVSTDRDGAQTLTFQLAHQGVLSGLAPTNAALEQAALPTSEGVFDALFSGATQFPILIDIRNQAGNIILKHHTDAPTQAFDLATFPAGVYKIVARNAKGEFWGGYLDLQTGNPANINWGF